MSHSKNIYRILLDSEWELDDLYTFPHAYSQSYAFAYCLDSKQEVRNQERIDTALNTYPWKGGFSYVNIYSVLQSQVPRHDRPHIHTMSKSSPGWLDLVINVDVAMQIAESVGILLGTAVSAAETYKRIQKTLSEIKRYRRRNRLKQLQLEQEELAILMEMADDMARHIGFHNLADLHNRTGNPEVTLQLLLVHYRRLEVLGHYVRTGKVGLPTKG